jgi:hypothetical protein
MGFSRRTFVGLTAAAISVPALGKFSASAQEATPAAVTSLEIYLLTIEGTLAPASVEEARTVHNSTAGEPTSIAAAKSLGDVSHMVYLPITPASTGAGNVLFMDIWTSMAGLNQFFSNPQVQAQAAELFTKRDPVVWESAAGYDRYSIPAPQGMNDRVIVLIRGTVTSQAEAMAPHNAAVAGGIAKARAAGALSHDAYFRLPNPDESETTDFLAVDVWMNAEGPAGYYGDTAFQAATTGLFTAAPTATLWTYPEAEWAEW